MSRFILPSVLIVTAAFTTSAFAIDLPDSGRLLRESTPPPALKPQEQPQELVRPQQPVTAASSDVRVLVKGFEFVGNTVFSGTQLAALMSGFVGKKLTLAELNTAAAGITNAYREKGYFLASAYIPPQTIKADTLITIAVVEGVLESISVETKPETRVPKGIIQGYTGQVPVNKPATEDAMTAMVMTVNELPNISSRILLEPGIRPGTTAAKLEVTEGKFYGLSLDTDNYGNYSTGYYRVGAGLELYSPLQLGDLLTLRAQTSTSGDSQTVRSGYSLPVGPYGTKLSFDYSYVVYQLGRGFKELDANGDAHNLSLTVTQPLVRSRYLMLNATVAGEGKILDDRISSVNSNNQRHSASWQLGLSGVAMDTVLGGGSTSFSVGLISGSLTLDDAATKAKDQSASGLKTDGGYTKMSMNLARTQTIYQNLSLYAGAYGQWADKNLDSAEQISLGGPSAVRAWQNGDSNGDRGFVSTAELRYTLDGVGKLPGSLQLAGFIDYGYAVLHSDPIPGSTDNTRNLAGAGFGVSWFDANDFYVKSTVAWKTSGETKPADSPMVYFQVVKRF